MTLSRRRLASILATLALAHGMLATPRLAFAEPSAAERAAARTLANDGIDLAEAGKCGEAVDKLRRAAAIIAAPTILTPLGECQIALGKIVLGTETLRRAGDADVGSPPNALFVAAQKRAKDALDRALPRIGQLRIHVDIPLGRAFVVLVDTEELPSTLLDVERPTDPGVHRVEVSAVGYVTAGVLVTLAEGAHESVRLKPDPDPNAARAALPTAPAVVTPPPPRPDRSAASRTGAYVAFAAGGLGLAATAIFGVLALGKQSSLDSACGPSKLCPPSSSSDISALKTDAILSTIGLGVGLVGVGVGTFLLLSATASDSPSIHRASFRAAPYVGLGAIGLAGEFR